MYKSHGKDYLENNFTSEELDLIMRPPQGSNSIKTANILTTLEKDISVALPISPPLTPKFSPKKRYEVEEKVETALDLKIRRNSNIFVEKEDNSNFSKCELCQLSFVEKKSFLNHFDEIHKFSEIQTNTSNNMENKDQFENSGFKCVQCSKILMHKQSFVSHMRVIHGDYYGGNKWNGSKVVDMVLGDSDLVAKKDILEQKSNLNENNEPEIKRLKLHKKGKLLFYTNFKAIFLLNF